MGRRKQDAETIISPQRTQRTKRTALKVGAGQRMVKHQKKRRNPLPRPKGRGYEIQTPLIGSPVLISPALLGRGRGWEGKNGI